MFLIKNEIIWVLLGVSRQIQNHVEISCTAGKHYKFLTEGSDDAARTCEFVLFLPFFTVKV